MARAPKIPLAGIVSLGCSKNLVDTEYLAGGLGAGGWGLVPDRERADLLLINTCAFIGPAIEESHEVIADAVKWKEQRAGRSVVVAGCMVNRFAAELAARYPGVDLLLTPKQIPRLAEWLALTPPRPRRLGSPGRAFLPGDGLERSLTTGPWAYLKISDGCSNCCHYCLIPSIRGPHASRPRARVLDEARALIDAGVREINLVGQDITRFGEGRRGGGLAGLARAVAALPGDFRVRLLYLHPERVDHEIVRLFAETPKLCAYLDVPIQHASGRVLRGMNRRYARRDLERLFSTLRRGIPGVALRTTVMVGYPGEGRREFDELLAFLRAHPFENLGAFIFSPQPGTKAAGLPGAVPREEAEARYHEVMMLQAALASDLWSARVGDTTEALLLGPAPGRSTIFTARTPWQAPEVDGQIRVHGRGTVGTWVPVLVTGAGAYDLEGTTL
jgi:ribosomal protein S12 methylthiotransferase